MRRSLVMLASVVAVGALSACADVPMAPEVATWPGDGKTDDAFHQDKLQCRQMASDQVSTRPAAAAAGDAGISANRVRVSGSQAEFDDTYALCMVQKGDVVHGSPSGTVHNTAFTPVGSPSGAMNSTNPNPF